VSISIDHLMWGAPDLAVGMSEAARLFGVEPAAGGAHPGLGTRNALLSLGERVYLEVIAPDPDQDLRGTLGERLRTLERCALVTWAAASGDLPGLAARAGEQGLKVRGPARTQRQTPSGELLEWELLFLGGHDFPSLLPFCIDWLGSPHPAAQNPRGGEFVDLVLRSPQHEALAELFAALGIAAKVEAADEPGLVARIRVGDEIVELPSSAQTRGLSF